MDNMIYIMFMGSIFGKPSQGFIRPIGSHMDLKGLLCTLKCNRISHERRIYLVVFQFIFCSGIAKGLAICEFEDVISVEYCIFKPLNSYMLGP
jgi:hypothetical protein